MSALSETFNRPLWGDVWSDKACSRLNIALTLAEISRLAQIRILPGVRQARYHAGTDSTSTEIHGGCIIPFIVIHIVTLDVRDRARSWKWRYPVRNRGTTTYVFFVRDEIARRAKLPRTKAAHGSFRDIYGMIMCTTRSYRAKPYIASQFLR